MSKRLRGGVDRDERGAARRSRGFTLIEVMVVMVIIGVLATLIVPSVIGRADESRAIAARADINTLQQALKLYRLDNQRYPTAAQGLRALVSRPGVEPLPRNWRPYLEKMPEDPWGHDYQYLVPGLHGAVDIFSFGADGAPGGSGNDADIGSWQ